MREQQLYGVYTKAPSYDWWQLESTHTSAAGARVRRRLLHEQRRLAGVYVPELGQRPPSRVPPHSRIYVEPGCGLPQLRR